MINDGTDTACMSPANSLYCLDELPSDALGSDNKEEFLSVINRKLHIYGTGPQHILRCVIERNAVKWAEALITGLTPLTVDLNLPCCPCTGAFPIHLTVLCCPSMVELILYYGARTDIRHPISDDEEHSNMLPLQIALRSIVNWWGVFSEWVPKHAIYKLITIFCLPRIQNLLETMGLLAWTTKETKEIFLELAMQGKIIELAALLMVAHKKVYSIMDRVVKCFDSIEINHPLVEEDQGEKVASIRHLFEVFKQAGDDISAYVKKDKFYVTKHDTIVDVTCLLKAAGFHLEDSDADLIDYK